MKGIKKILRDKYFDVDLVVEAGKLLYHVIRKNGETKVYLRGESFDCPLDDGNGTTAGCLFDLVAECGVIKEGTVLDRHWEEPSDGHRSFTYVDGKCFAV